MHEIDPDAIIRDSVGSYIEPGHSYPRPLPEDLVPWYCYTVDGGHSVLVALASHLDQGGSFTDALVPAPVKSVLRVGWTVRDGYVVADLPYNSDIGLIVEKGDDEFGDEPAAPEPEVPLHAYKVGELYNPRRTSWPETGHLRLTRHQAELAIFLASPTAKEIADTGKGVAQWALVELPGVAVLCYRFGQQPWSDTPYQLAKGGADEHIPQEGEGGGFLLHVLLVDARTGILRTQRATALPPKLSAAIRAALQRQLDQPVGDVAAMAALDQLYAQYPDTAVMVRERADIRA